MARRLAWRFRLRFDEREGCARSKGSKARWTANRRITLALAVIGCCILAIPARAQQQQLPEDPEDEKQVGLWLDQGISTGLSANDLWMGILRAVRRGSVQPVRVLRSRRRRLSSAAMVHLDTDISLPALSWKSHHRIRKSSATQSHPEHIPWPVAADSPYAHRGTLS